MPGIAQGCANARHNARMAESVDAPELGSDAERHGGSSPSAGIVLRFILREKACGKDPAGDGAAAGRVNLHSFYLRVKLTAFALYIDDGYY